MILNNDNVEFEYLLLNDFDRKYGLVTNTVGYQEVKPNEKYPVSGHPLGYNFNPQVGRRFNEYQFIYITKGEGILKTEQSEFEIKSGNLIFIVPNQWHSYFPLKEIGWTEYYIGFKGEFVENIMRNDFFTNRIQVFNIGSNEEFLKLFYRAIEIVKMDMVAIQQHLAGIIYHMLGLLLYETENQKANILNKYEFVEKAKMIMNENVIHKISPMKVAEMTNIKYTKFRKDFKAITGFSPAQYFQELKMRKAKQLLAESCKLVKEISYILNYKTVENFVIIFKTKIGLTPTEYRKYSR